MTDQTPTAPKGPARFLPLAIVVLALGAFFLFDLDRYFSLDAP
ncbi:MAG: TVP38/TMEM64 family protein, partial [Rhodomicrobium sp.]|nr:TVP38/TMEM64 family protein [Rhodomicrobium sp.]